MVMILKQLPTNWGGGLPHVMQEICKYPTGRVWTDQIQVQIYHFELLGKDLDLRSVSIINKKLIWQTSIHPIVLIVCAKDDGFPIKIIFLDIDAAINNISLETDLLIYHVLYTEERVVLEWHRYENKIYSTCPFYVSSSIWGQETRPNTLNS